MDGTKNNIQKPYVAVMLLNGMAVSIYYTTTRIAIGEHMGENYAFIALMVAMEAIPGVFAFLLGYLSDRIKRGLMLYSGFIASFFFGSMGLVRVEHYPYLTLVYTLFYMIFQPAVMGTVLSESGGIGATLSFYLLSSSLGWALGGVLPGTIMRKTTLSYSFALGALILALSTMISIKYYPVRGYPMPSLNDMKKALSYNKKIIATFVLSSSGIMLFIGAYSLRLYMVIGNPIAYGFVFTTITGVLGALVRPLAGKLTDRLTPQLVLLFSLVGYIVLGMVAPFLPRLPLIIVWLTPIYPFYELSSYAWISRRMPANLQSTAAGVFSTSSSLGGIINTLASLTLYNAGFSRALSTSILVLVVSASYLSYLQLKRVI